MVLIRTYLLTSAQFAIAKITIVAAVRQPSSFGGGWFWRGFGDGIVTTKVENTPVGTLVVEIFDIPKASWKGETLVHIDCLT
jgi:hypothetical protein